MSFVTFSAVSILIGIFHIGKSCFWVPFFIKLLLRNYVADFVEICNVCARKAIIKAAKRIINSDDVCHNYSDLNFGVTFFGTQCICNFTLPLLVNNKWTAMRSTEIFNQNKIRRCKSNFNKCMKQQITTEFIHSTEQFQGQQPHLYTNMVTWCICTAYALPSESVIDSTNTGNIQVQTHVHIQLWNQFLEAIFGLDERHTVSWHHAYIQTVQCRAQKTHFHFRQESAELMWPISYWTQHTNLSSMLTQFIGSTRIFPADEVDNNKRKTENNLECM